MMMAQSFVPPGMGPGHPGMAHGHPMGGVPHPGAAHMSGQPGPMMQGMHPGVSGPQVTQGPMVSGMPQGAGTPAPMQGHMAMAHMAPQQQHMFQQQNPQMSIGQMQQMNNHIARQRMMMQQQQQQAQQQHQQQQAQQQQQQQQQAQQQQQQHGMSANMQGNPHFNPAMQMKMGNAMQAQHSQHLLAQLTANQQQIHFQQAQQQRMMAQQAQHAQQQAQALQRAQSQQAAAAQQMQMSRSNEPTTQPPPSHPTPAPQNQPAPPPPQNNQQAQPQPPQQQQQQQPPQPPQQTPQAQPKAQPTPQQNQNQGTPQPQVKQDGPEEETPISKQEIPNPIMMQDIPKQQANDFTGQCILQLLLYQDNLANPERPEDIGYWEETMSKYFSEYGSIRQQLYNNKVQLDKSFQLQYPSLARFYYLHFTNGIKQILMQSFDHNQGKLPNGGIHIWSTKASLTYVFKNDIRVTTQGSLKVSFDEMQKIEHLYIATSGWTEYIPRNSLQPPSPDQQKMSPKLNKNQKRNQKMQDLVPFVPHSPVNDFGVPSMIQQFLEIAEVMTAMGPLMEYFHSHPGVGPRDALARINHENQNQMHIARMQNANAMMVNGQVGFPNQRAMNMAVPNSFQSPGLQHLKLPQGQGSPHMGGPNHTPSPAHNSQGGIAMVHQMSAQGSNLSGSQGPSTNTSPNVSNKKRRQSAVKLEEDTPNNEGGNNRVKPSPKIGGQKRQKA